ncbi:MAG: iron-containing alcohol dehydrogenase [Oscillospiraceae bacterium]|nr:iron-containing alcohol dehydrogenase [Oscillospiraceae bacterium]
MANIEKFRKYKKIFVVTSKSSAKQSGALDDILKVSDEVKAECRIFDKIMENPLLSVCHEGGQAAFEFGADLIVGIGGGSPMDAAKAAACFAGNPTMAPEALFDSPKKGLPIFAVPTTAGTGSEANPYAVITLDGQNLKKTFNHPASYAKTAFLDPAYTQSLPYGATVGTALDALCHCAESCLSVKSTPFSELYAYRGISCVYPNLEKLLDLKGAADYDMREQLMFGSLCGGIAINTTGTCFPHPMGYNITFFDNLPHGKACALFFGEFMDMHEKFITRGLCEAFGVPLERAKETVRELAAYHEKFDDETLKFYVSKVKSAKNFTNSKRKISEDEIFDIYKRCVGK